MRLAVTKKCLSRIEQIVISLVCRIWTNLLQFHFEGLNYSKLFLVVWYLFLRERILLLETREPIEGTTSLIDDVS